MRPACDGDSGGATESATGKVGLNERKKSSLSVFIDTVTAAPNPEAKLLSDFQKDTHANKVYLAGKECLNEEGQIAVIPLIARIQKQISTDPTQGAGYAPSLGLTEFNRRATELALGKNSQAIVENRVLGIQAVGSSGALRLGAELLARWYDVRSAWCGPVYLPTPCDDSLPGVFEAVGIQAVRRYRYWDPAQRGVSVPKLLEDLGGAPEQSVVVLFASAHCPTGAYLSQEHWKLIIELMVSRRLFPFFLLPAQGLCHGDVELDAWSVRHCASAGMELLCAQSFSHNFGLYGERVGHLLCVLKQSSTLLAVQSQACRLVGSLWSRPSMGGARVVATVLSNPAHLIEWQEGVRREVEMGMLIRERLREKLRLLGSPGCWDHVTQQGGLYCCTGLNARQVESLVKRYHLYLPSNGCLNVSAINSRNLDYVAESIHLVLTSPL